MHGFLIKSTYLDVMMDAVLIEIKRKGRNVQKQRSGLK
jgi:hypothetical protein